MYAIATFLVVAAFTAAFTQITRGALIATGMPPEMAGFQARSAFSGAGFTTTEAENVVNHPLRRRIIGTAMFVGNLGTPTLVVTVLLGFIAPGPGSTVERSMVTVAGLLFLAGLILNKPSTRMLQRVGQRYAQSRLLPSVGEGGVELLTVGDNYVVAEAPISRESAESPRSLRGLDQALPDVHVLGVRRDGNIVAEPPADLSLHEGDALLVFGRRADLASHGLLS